MRGAETYLSLRGLGFGSDIAFTTRQTLERSSFPLNQLLAGQTFVVAGRTVETSPTGYTRTMTARMSFTAR